MDVPLVKEVEKRPMLYNHNHKEYKNNGRRIRVWREVATVLNVSPDFCRVRWKRIRDRFARTERRNKSSVDEPETGNCPLHEHLGFLKPFIIDYDKFDSKDCAPDETLKRAFTEFDPDVQQKEETAEPPKRRQEPAEPPKRRLRPIVPKDSDIDRILAAFNAPSESFDALDYFGLTIAEDLRNMEPSEQRRVRMEIQVVLTNARYQN